MFQTCRWHVLTAIRGSEAHNTIAKIHHNKAKKAFKDIIADPDHVLDYDTVQQLQAYYDHGIKAESPLPQLNGMAAFVHEQSTLRILLADEQVR